MKIRISDFAVLVISAVCTLAADKESTSVPRQFTADVATEMTLNECLISDTCPYQFDGVCNDNGFDCAEGTDCFDCGVDTCSDFRYDFCGCVEAGCLWCPGDAYCYDKPLDPDTLANLGKFGACAEEADYRTSCEPAEKNFFNDPLYDSMWWSYDMINILPVWEMGLTGKGVHVRINDDGVDAYHPEFSQRFDVENSCNISQPNINSTTGEMDSHGTACASIILGEANNGVCAAGIAPGATVSSCIMVTNDMSITEKDIFLYKMEIVDISSNSWGYSPCVYKEQDSLHRYLQDTCPFNPDHPDSPCSACAEGVDYYMNDCYYNVTYYCSTYYEEDPLACANYLDWYVSCNYYPLPSETGAALAKSILEGRGGLGIIFVWAGGNDYTIGVDVNDDPYSSSRYTISVSAVGKDGFHASYSTPGATNFVAAPGGDSESISNNIVASAGGGCIDITMGTSFAAPVVSGVIALMLEANPTLGWRDVQGILALTAQLTDMDDDSWVTNGAGWNHSNKYGFGVVDAYAAVNLSMSWDNWGPEKQIMRDSGIINLAIENNSTTVASSTLMVSGMEGFVTESVSVYLDLDHYSRGDLLIVLTSPSGTESVLHPSKRREVSNEFVSWKLGTVKNFLEDPNGDWTLSIVDQNPYDELAGACVDYDSWVIYCDTYSNETDPRCVDGAPINETVVVALRSEVDPDSNLTVLDLCCVCGGGSIVTDIETLISWKIVIYGHEEGKDVDTSVTKAGQKLLR